MHFHAVFDHTLQLKGDRSANSHKIVVLQCFSLHRNHGVLLVLFAVSCSVEACFCSNNVQPCPPGCAAGQCIMKPAICTCTTGCSKGGCDANYVVSLCIQRTLVLPVYTAYENVQVQLCYISSIHRPDHCCNHNRNCQASCAASSTRRPASSQSQPSAPAMPAHQAATVQHALAPVLALLAIAALMEY
jgi:hypothetical protein